MPEVKDQPRQQKLTGPALAAVIVDVLIDDMHKRMDLLNGVDAVTLEVMRDEWKRIVTGQLAGHQADKKS